MVTFVVEGGRQEKLRASDLLGALTGEAGIPGDAVGKIDILATRSYVAVRRSQAEEVLKKVGPGKWKIKGKAFRVRKMG
jgi:ATP-independent RNA helicase DbpA